MGQHRLLSAAEERRLFTRLATGVVSTGEAGRIREKIIRHNLRLVAKETQRFYLSPGSSLDRDDLFQAGVEGLMKAVNRYDPGRGTRFSTCAVPWIRQAIGRHVYDAGLTIRVPVNVRGDLERARRVAAEIAATGREPEEGEVARGAGLCAGRLRSTDLARAVEVPASLEAGGAPGMEDGSVPVLKDSLADPSGALEEEVLGRMGEDARARVVEAALAALPGDLAVVLRMRYGLEGDAPMTLDEAGRELAVSGEVVRRRQARALDLMYDRLHRSIGDDSGVEERGAA